MPGRKASVASKGPIGAEMRPNSSTATTAPVRATAMRSDQRPATRTRCGQGEGGAVVGSVPGIPAALGSLTPTTLSSGRESRRAEDPAERHEPHEADGRGDRGDDGD